MLVIQNSLSTNLIQMAYRWAAVMVWMIASFK